MRSYIPCTEENQTFIGPLPNVNAFLGPKRIKHFLQSVTTLVWHRNEKHFLHACFKPNVTIQKTRGSQLWELFSLNVIVCTFMLILQYKSKNHQYIYFYFMNWRCTAPIWIFVVLHSGTHKPRNIQVWVVSCWKHVVPEKLFLSSLASLITCFIVTSILNNIGLCNFKTEESHILHLCSMFSMFQTHFTVLTFEHFCCFTPRP